MTDAYRDFPCSIFTSKETDSEIDNISRKDAEQTIWYCDNYQKKFVFDELTVDIDGMLVCPDCGNYVEPIEEED